jgi:hypothetical protein
MRSGPAHVTSFRLTDAPQSPLSFHSVMHYAIFMTMSVMTLAASSPLSAQLLRWR